MELSLKSDARRGISAETYEMSRIYSVKEEGALSRQSTHLSVIWRVNSWFFFHAFDFGIHHTLLWAYSILDGR